MEEKHEVTKVSGIDKANLFKKKVIKFVVPPSGSDISCSKQATKRLFDIFFNQLQNVEDIERIRDGLANIAQCVGCNKNFRIDLCDSDEFAYIISLLDLNDTIASTYICQIIEVVIYKNRKGVDIMTKSGVIERIVSLIPLPSAIRAINNAYAISATARSVIKKLHTGQMIFNIIPKVICSSVTAFACMDTANRLFDDITPTEETVSCLCQILSSYAVCDTPFTETVIKGALQLVSDNIPLNEVLFNAIVSCEFVPAFMANYEHQEDEILLINVFEFLKSITLYEGKSGADGANLLLESGFCEFVSQMERKEFFEPEFIIIASKILIKNEEILNEVFMQNFTISDIVNKSLQIKGALSGFVLTLLRSDDPNVANYSLQFDLQTIIMWTLSSNDIDLIKSMLKSLICAAQGNSDSPVTQFIDELSDDPSFRDSLETLTESENPKIKKRSELLLTILDEEE